MQAVRAHSFGGPEVLVLEELDTPSPGPGQVLIKVMAAAVNFADIMRRRDDLYPFPTELPYHPGGEVAGVVEQLGAGVDGPPVGTRVFALVGADGSTGYAQYAIAQAEQVIPTPGNVPDGQAAGIVIAGASAALFVNELARITPGDSVLVEGAGGGVGSYIVQLATLAGANVIAVASTPERREQAIKLGASLAIDYHDPAWEQTIREASGGKGIDAVWLVGGGDSLSRAVSVLAPFGRVVVAGRAGGESIEFTPELIETFFYRPSLGQSIHVFNLGLMFGLAPEKAVGALQDVIGKVAQGLVAVPLSEVLPLREASEAHRRIENRQSVGKVVLNPWAA